MRWRIFSVITRVLPDPGPARINCMPVSVTAFCWEGERGMVIGDVRRRDWGVMRGGYEVAGLELESA